MILYQGLKNTDSRYFFIGTLTFVLNFLFYEVVSIMVKTSVLNIKTKLNSNSTLMNINNRTDIETDIAMSLALTSGLIQVNITPSFSFKFDRFFLFFYLDSICSLSYRFHSEIYFRCDCDWIYDGCSNNRNN